MPMNGNTMGSAIAAAVAALTPAEKQNLVLAWQTIANEIVTHIQSNGAATGVDSNGDSHNLTLT